MWKIRLVIIVMVCIFMLPIWAQDLARQRVDGKISIVNSQSFDYSGLRVHLFLRETAGGGSEEKELPIRANGTFDLDLRSIQTYRSGSSLILSITSFDPTIRMDQEMEQPSDFYSIRPGEGVIVAQREISVEELKKSVSIEFKLVQGGAVVLGLDIPKDLSGSISFSNEKGSSSISRRRDVFLFEREFELQGVVFGGLNPGHTKMRMIDDDCGVIFSSPIAISQGTTIPVIFDWKGCFKQRP